MTYVLTLYGVDDDKFIQEICSDVTGVEDLTSRISTIVDFYEQLRGSGYKLVSVTLVA